MTSRFLAFGLALSGLVPAAPAIAAADPVGDFLPTFTGAPSAELDFIGTDARFDGATSNLSLTLAGPVSGSANVLHVWGVNRGAGTPRLNINFDPDIEPIFFDSVVVAFGNGTLRVVTFPQMGAPTITDIAGGAIIDGANISGAVPLALLPSRGFAPTSYTFQLWSRLRVNPMQDGPNTELADLGPRIFASVPEPATWAMLIGGFGLVGAAMRRRSVAVLA